MGEITAAAFLMAMLVSGLVQVGKLAGLPTRLAPGASVVIGVIVAALADKGNITDVYDGNVGRIIIGGAVTGLVASGLYDNVRAVANR